VFAASIVSAVIGTIVLWRAAATLPTTRKT
jgi:hypothetical protein